MKIIQRTIHAGGVPAFFFFSWIIQLLWNGILFDQLSLVPTRVNYWQAAALWFLTIILFAWVGIGVRQKSWATRRRSAQDLGDRIERNIKQRVRHWSTADGDWDDLGRQIESKIKRGFAHWVDVDEDTDWDDIGERIERKIEKKLRDWADEEEDPS